MALYYGKRGRSLSKRWLIVLAILAVLLLLGGAFLVLNRDVSDNNNQNSEQPINLLPNEPTPQPVKSETDKVGAEIEAYLADKQGTYGYRVIELDDGRSFGARDTELYTAASTIKVAMAAYVYNQIESGAISPNTVLTYTAADYEEGTGSLRAEPVGSKYKVSYLLERMIVVSDNVATNILSRTYGRSAMQKFIESKGLSGIDIPNNDVTPKGMAELLAALYGNELISAAHKAELISYMKKSITPTRLVAGVPADVEVAHKIGSFGGAISDIGIVYTERPYVIAVYSTGVAWGETTDAVIAQISRVVYDFETSF